MQAENIEHGKYSEYEIKKSRRTSYRSSLPKALALHFRPRWKKWSPEVLKHKSCIFYTEILKLLKKKKELITLHFVDTQAWSVEIESPGIPPRGFLLPAAADECQN